MLLLKTELAPGSYLNGYHLLRKKSTTLITLRQVNYLKNWELKLKRTQVLPEAHQKQYLHLLFPSTTHHLRAPTLEPISRTKKSHQPPSLLPLILLQRWNSEVTSHPSQDKKSDSRPEKSDTYSTAMFQLPLPPWEYLSEVHLLPKLQVQALDSATRVSPKTHIQQHTPSPLWEWRYQHKQQ